MQARRQWRRSTRNKQQEVPLPSHQPTSRVWLKLILQILLQEEKPLHQGLKVFPPPRLWSEDIRVPQCKTVILSIFQWVPFLTQIFSFPRESALRENWTDGPIFQGAKQQLPLEYMYKCKHSNLLGFPFPLRSTLFHYFLKTMLLLSNKRNPCLINPPHAVSQMWIFKMSCTALFCNTMCCVIMPYESSVGLQLDLYQYHTSSRDYYVATFS